MAAFESLKGWSSTAKHTVTASYLAWTLDAYDFFLLTLVFKDIAAQFDDLHHRGRGRHHADPGLPADRRLHLRAAGRPLRPPARS